MAKPPQTAGQRRGEPAKTRGPKRPAMSFAEMFKVFKTADGLCETIIGAPGSSSWLDVRDAAFSAFLLHTGVRSIEARAACCGHVRVHEGSRSGSLVVPRGKGNVAREVPLTAQACRSTLLWLAAKTEVRESVVDGAPLFCAYPRGQRAAPADAFISARAVNDIWRSGLHVAGVHHKTYSPHVARHSAGMLVWVATGGNADKVAQFLGHTSVETTRRHYLHLDVERLAAELSTAPVWAEGAP